MSNSITRYMIDPLHLAIQEAAQAAQEEAIHRIMTTYPDWSVEVMELNAACKAAQRLAFSGNHKETRDQLLATVGDLLKYGGQLKTISEKINKQPLIHVNMGIVDNHCIYATWLAGRISAFLAVGTDEALADLRTSISANKIAGFNIQAAIEPAKRGRGGSQILNSVLRVTYPLFQQYGYGQWAQIAENTFKMLDAKPDRTPDENIVFYEWTLNKKKFKQRKDQVKYAYEGWQNGELEAI